MRTRTRTALTAATTAATTAALLGAGASAAGAATVTGDHHPGHRPVGTVFVQTDGTAGNAVVVYDRRPDGTLRRVDSYSTGGVGGVLDGSVVDHTASQGSLVRAGSSLFAVNAGSDTITSFAVSGDRLHRRQVIASGGRFPVSIAVHGNRVFVLDARGGGSIQGYLDVGGYLVAVPSWHRALGLDPDATPEFTHTPAEVAFTPDGSKLVVSTKGNSSAFDVFDVRGFRVSARPVITTLPGAVPFGFAFDRRGTLVTSEAGTNAVATLRVNRNGTLTPRTTVATGQQATCWVVVSGRHVWASNAASGTLSGFRIGRHATLTATGTTATDGGTVDAAATRDGRFLYVQTGAAGIVDEFAVAPNGALQRVGAVTVPGGAGGEGIVAS